MLRPIDVIFKHPVKKFTVIYQNGKLWQLPRLDFTGKSLLVKKPYKDSREHIFVAANQTLDGTDVALIAELSTVHLPDSIVGRNVDEFEAWWRNNWSQFQEEIAVKEQRRQHAKQLLEQAHLARVSPDDLLKSQSTHLPQPPTLNQPTAIPTTPQPQQPNSVSQPQSPNSVSQPQLQKIVTPAPVTSSAVANPAKPNSGEHDIFDDMLDDLMKGL